MKMNKNVVAIVVALGMTSAAHAAVSDQGSGKVTFTGSIIDAACSISPEHSDQTVELGQISKVALKDSGTSQPRHFEIKLENCEFGEKEPNKLQITFTGKEANGSNDLLGITGTAKGAGVAILDAAGNKIKLGEPTSPQELQNGDNTLLFSAYLQGEGASGEGNPAAEIVPGDFQAVTDFKLAYN
ncbi:fimbrial protein [Enterobacter bugandensis]|uniref:fimbrial protein n=1 Tax=Enterobacter bugandensis TaxID=881260 RepID=UPI0013D7BDFF|nr:fimbrial protein [Enterobacter bugandensis]